MKIRYILFIIAISCFTTQSMGQDKIYLRDGNKVKGRYVVELSTDTTLYLQLANSGIHIPFRLIKGARFSRWHRKNPGMEKRIEKIEYPEIKTGHYHRVGISALVGSHDSSWDAKVDYSASFSTFTGYKWTNMINIGGKVGLDFYDNFISVPIAAHYEVELSRRSASPFFEVGAGYGFAWVRKRSQQPFDKARGGAHYYASWGYRFRTEKGNFILKIGGTGQHVIQEVSDRNSAENYWGVVRQNRLIRRFTIGVGYTF